MTLDRQTKEQMVEHYAQTFRQLQSAFVLGYIGITAPEDTELRAKIRAVGGRYEVVKNSLTQRALKDSELVTLTEHFDGPTAIAYSDDDIVGLAKVLRDFSKNVPALQFKGGVLDGEPVDADQIHVLADLPSREDLVTQFVFLLQSPIVRAVRCLGAITPRFVRVLDQIRQKKEASSS